MSTGTQQQPLFQPEQLDAELRTCFRNPAMQWDPQVGPLATCKGIAWQWREDDEENPVAVCVHDAKRFREHWGMPITDERARLILFDEAGKGKFYTAATAALRRWQEERGEWGGES